MLPGILHENERRRSRKVSGAGATGGSERASTSASTHAVTSGLANVALQAQKEVDAEDSE